MNTLAVVLTCVDIVVCIALIILVMSQEGNDQGMGVVGGSGTNSFYEKSKGRTFDEKLKKITLFTAILFAILTVVLFLVLARGF